MRNFTQCDSLLLGDQCGAHTVPYIESRNRTAKLEHEATTSKISDDQLYYAQQRGLDRQRQLADLVEEDGPALGRSEHARLIARRAGERAFAIAEELTFEEIARHRGAVEGDVRQFRARREIVDRARHQLLAAA